MTDATPQGTPVTELADWLADVRRYVHTATDEPWWFDEDELSWRLHGVMDRLPAQRNIPEQILNKQILKAPKRNTPYAEYWPDPADGEFIVRARTDLPALASFAATMLEFTRDLRSLADSLPGSDLHDARAEELRGIAETIRVALDGAHAARRDAHDRDQLATD